MPIPHRESSAPEDVFRGIDDESYCKSPRGSKGAEIGTNYPARWPRPCGECYTCKRNYVNDWLRRLRDHLHEHPETQLFVTVTDASLASVRDYVGRRDGLYVAVGQGNGYHFVISTAPSRPVCCVLAPLEKAVEAFDKALMTAYDVEGREGHVSHSADWLPAPPPKERKYRKLPGENLDTKATTADMQAVAETFPEMGCNVVGSDGSVATGVSQWFTDHGDKAVALFFEIAEDFHEGLDRDVARAVYLGRVLNVDDEQEPPADASVMREFRRFCRRPRERSNVCAALGGVA